MNVRDIAGQILDLATLSGASPQSIRPFLGGWALPGSVFITVPTQDCCVITNLETSNIDQAAAQSLQLKPTGRTGIVAKLPVAGSGDLFYVFPNGKLEVVVVGTATAGNTAWVQIRGFFLPRAVLPTLSRNRMMVLDHTTGL